MSGEWIAARIAKEVRRGHPHRRVLGGYVQCGCREDWDSHKLHVEEKVVEALFLRLVAVEELMDEWREGSARFGWRRASDYADDLMDAMCDHEVTD